MCRIEGVLKNGVGVTVAEAPTKKEAEALLDGLVLDMMDPTSARIVYMNGTRAVLVKDLSAVWIEEE